MLDSEKTMAYEISGSDRGHQTKSANGFVITQYSNQPTNMFCAFFALNWGAV